MQRWTRKAAAAVTAVVLATGSIGCTDDDFKRLVTDIFINLLGAGQYSSISVTIDPNDIGAFIDTTSCDLASALSGCDLSVVPVGESLVADNGTTGTSSTSITFPSGPVLVTISNCPDPIRAFSNLASCGTLEAPGNIAQTVPASGTCYPGSQCDTNPLVCVTTDGPNGFCGFPPPTPTTSSTSTSSTSNTIDTTTTSSTTSSTTSTTMGSPGLSCVIQFGVTNGVGLVGALSYETDYSLADGTFDGAGSSVNCTNLVGLLGQFNDQDAQQNLITAIIDTNGFSTPTAVADCTFLTNGLTPPSAGGFTITVTDASDPDINPISPNVEILSIICDTGPTTSSSSTSSSSTSTSVTLTTTTGGGITTTTINGLTNFDVFYTIGQSATVGALQFETDYATASANSQGAFVGMGQGVDCEVIVDLGLGFPAFNNCIGPGSCGLLGPDTLVVAITSVSGFTTSAGEIIVRCTWASATQPIPTDFAVTVVDASDPTTNPISVSVAVGMVIPQP